MQRLTEPIGRVGHRGRVCGDGPYAIERREGLLVGLLLVQPDFGSAALLMTTSEKAGELGLRPIARVHTVARAGSDVGRRAVVDRCVVACAARAVSRWSARRTNGPKGRTTGRC
mgnify:CR=1 FL=1